MPTIKVKNSAQVRQFNFEKPQSWDKGKRSFSATAFSEEPVYIPAYPEPFYEILSHNPEHIRLTRAMSGMPLLDNHKRYDGIKDQIGAVANPRIVNRELVLDVRISKNKKHEDLVEDIDDGIVKNMSGGYRVFRYEDVTPQGEKIRTLMAVDWEPHELSFTPVNFDHNSQVRSMSENEESEIEIQTTMPTATAAPQAAAEGTPTPAAASAAPAPAAEPPVAEGARALPNPAPIPQAAAPVPAPAETPAERTRALEILQAATAARMAPDFVTQHIQAGTGIDQVRQLILTHLTSNSPVSTQGNQRPAPVQPVVTLDVIEKTRALMEIGACRKFGVVPHKEDAFDREELVASEKYRNMSLMDMARNYMYEASGDVEILKLPTKELAKRALISTSSSDFPVLLEGTARRKLQADYKIQADTWRRIAVTGSVTDFREWTRLRGGTIGNLDKVNENGEFKNKAIPDAAGEKVKIDTYGNTINVTRQMLINDDLGAFLRLAGMLGRSSARSIEAAMYNLIKLNGGLGPNMSDGLTLIHPSHGNVGATGAYSETTIQSGIDLMSSQMDLSNNDYLDLNPEILLIPKGLKVLATKLNINEYENGGNKYAQQNIYRGLFKDIVDTPRLTGTRHYQLADPNVAPVFEINFLDGNETPFLDERNEFYVDGTAWKIRHDWGVAAVDWKGIVSFAGA